MAYGNALGLSLPTVSVTAGPTYATQINAFLTALQDVVEAKVTPAGISMNADLSFLDGATYRRAKDLLATSFQVQASPISAATYPAALYFSGGAGDLYANDGSGNQVRITASGAVNVTAAGGITGSGYGVSSVEVNWDSGNQAYRMKSGAGANAYADVVCDDLLLNDGSSNFIGFRAPAIATDYNLTLPTAVPASSGTILQSDNAGNLSFSNAIESLTTTVGGITVVADQHVTVSGTGLYKHGDRFETIAATAWQPATPAVWTPPNNNVPYWSTASGTGATKHIAISIPVINGRRVRAISVAFWGGGAAAADFTLYRAGAGDTATSIATWSQASDGVWTDAASGTIDLTETLFRSYYVDCLHAQANDRVGRVIVTYDQP